MHITFDTVWVRKGLYHVTEVQAYLSRVPEGAVRFFDNTQQVVTPGASMSEKIARGKRVLVIDRRSGSLLDRFENHDVGSVCPNFPKLVPSTNCPYGCQYCFLSGTYRACRPFVCSYVINFAKLEHELARQYHGTEGVTVVSAGEMSDPLACDVLGYMPRIVEMFGRIGNLKLLLLTKSGVNEIQPLLGIDHNNHTITSWSITCEEVVARYESGNEPIASRLDAAKVAQDAGYEVRFRLDPLMVFDGWQSAFARTIADVYGHGIHPSRFTLGSFRLLGNLRSIIRARFPESDILQQPLVNDGGKRQRYPHEIREALYRHAIACIRGHDSRSAKALCKETPAMHRVLAGLVDVMRCNCLP